MLIWNQLKARAAAHPDKRALACGDIALTYAQFAAQVERVAHAWLRQGLQPGDRIALHMRNGIELAACYYLVEIDADGFVWFRGRKKEIIVRGGSNISPQEVEETLYQHPAVAEAGVIGEPDT